MLNIFANTFRTATRSSNSQDRKAKQTNDTNRRQPAREDSWGDRRQTRTQQRRLSGMSDHMLADVGITRGDIDRMFD